MGAEQIRHTRIANFIWKNGGDLRKDFKHADFGEIILRFTRLRRLECILEPARGALFQASRDAFTAERSDGPC